jgi:hypothetical protein
MVGVLCGIVGPTGEVIWDSVSYRPLVDFITMTNVDAVHVFDPGIKDVVRAL